MLRFGIVLAITGLAFIWLEAMFITGVDANGVLRETFLLPFGVGFAALGATLAIASGMRRAVRNAFA